MVAEEVQSSFAECKLLRHFLSERTVRSPLVFNLCALNIGGQKSSQLIKKKAVDTSEICLY